MARESGPDLARGSFKTEQHQPRVIQPALDGCEQWTEFETIAGLQQRWRRALLGPGSEVTIPEYHRGEMAHLGGVERSTACQTDFDRAAAAHMAAVQAGRQGGRVVRDDQIAGPQQLRKGRAGPVLDRAAPVDDQQLGGRGALDRVTGRDHRPSSGATAPRTQLSSAAQIASASSRAAIWGRFKLARSASGTAAA
jgi:hypothetical protein